MRLLSAGPALTQPSMQRAAKHLSGSRAACGGEEDAGISFVDRSARADTEQVYSNWLQPHYCVHRWARVFTIDIHRSVVSLINSFTSGKIDQWGSKQQ